MLAREYSGCAAGEIRGDTALRRQLEQILPVWASHTYKYINSVCMRVYSASVCACMCVCVWCMCGVWVIGVRVCDVCACVCVCGVCVMCVGVGMVGVVYVCVGDWCACV